MGCIPSRSWQKGQMGRRLWGGRGASTRFLNQVRSRAFTPEMKSRPKLATVSVQGSPFINTHLLLSSLFEQPKVLQQQVQPDYPTRHSLSTPCNASNKEPSTALYMHLSHTPARLHTFGSFYEPDQLGGKSLPLIPLFLSPCRTVSLTSPKYQTYPFPTDQNGAKYTL